jgi:hypothetical protein
MLTGTTPFKGQNRKKVQQNILNAALKIPGNLSFDSQQIIKKLLQRPVHKRLGHNGAREVMKADFFAAIDWNKLARKEIDAPYVPERVRFYIIAVYSVLFDQPFALFAVKPVGHVSLRIDVHQSARV